MQSSREWDYGEHRDYETPATPQERLDAPREYHCWRGQFNLPEEWDAWWQAKEVNPYQDAEARQLRWQESWDFVLDSKRSCPYYEGHRPALSLEGHLEIQHRREDRLWTAGVALVAAIIGGAIATVGTLVFGPDINIITPP